jgi:hypothetical protein
MDKPTPRRFSYADLVDFDPQKRWELIDGTPYSMAGASLLHQSVVGELYVALNKPILTKPTQSLRDNCYEIVFYVAVLRHGEKGDSPAGSTIVAQETQGHYITA